MIPLFQNLHFLTIWQHCFLIYLGRRPGQQKSELICIYAFFMLVSILLTLVTTFNLSHWTEKLRKNILIISHVSPESQFKFAAEGLQKC